MEGVEVGDCSIERGEGGGLYDLDGGDEDGFDSRRAEALGEVRGLVRGAGDEDAGLGHRGGATFTRVLCEYFILLSCCCREETDWCRYEQPAGLSAAHDIKPSCFGRDDSSRVVPSDLTLSVELLEVTLSSCGGTNAGVLQLHFRMTAKNEVTPTVVAAGVTSLLIESSLLCGWVEDLHGEDFVGFDWKRYDIAVQR